MREMIKTVNLDCNDPITIYCPFVSEVELKIIVNFLYSGKILCSNEEMGFQIEELLTELFGFPRMSTDEKSDTIVEKHQKDLVAVGEENDYNGGNIKVEVKSSDNSMVRLCRVQ